MTDLDIKYSNCEPVLFKEFKEIVFPLTFRDNYAPKLTEVEVTKFGVYLKIQQMSAKSSYDSYCETNISPSTIKKVQEFATKNKLEFLWIKSLPKQDWQPVIQAYLDFPDEDA